MTFFDMIQKRFDLAKSVSAIEEEIKSIVLSMHAQHCIGDEISLLGYETKGRIVRIEVDARYAIAGNPLFQYGKPSCRDAAKIRIVYHCLLLKKDGSIGKRVGKAYHEVDCGRFDWVPDTATAIRARGAQGGDEPC